MSDGEIELLRQISALGGQYGPAIGAVLGALWWGVRTYIRLRGLERIVMAQGEQIDWLKDSLPPADRSPNDFCECGHVRDAHVPVASMYPDLFKPPPHARGSCLECNRCDAFRKAPTPK